MEFGRGMEHVAFAGGAGGDPGIRVEEGQGVRRGGYQPVFGGGRGKTVVYEGSGGGILDFEGGEEIRYTWW